MRPEPLSLTPGMRAKSVQMCPETARQLEALVPDLRRIARQITGNWAAADDLVQKALMALWSQPARLAATPEALRREAFAALRAMAGAGAIPEKSRRNVA